MYRRKIIILFIFQVCKALRDKKYTKILDMKTQNYAFSDSYLFPYDDKNSMQEKVITH
jgi:hypothetical protein